MNAQIANCYAPTIHHLAQNSLEFSANGRADLLLAVDYDGDWNTGNNWENLEQFDGLDSMGEPDGINTEDINELNPKVYYSVVWTDIAWVVTYGFYHPRDYSKESGPCCNGSDILGLPGDSHENDFEVVIVVVSRIAGNGVNKFQVTGGYSTPHGNLSEYRHISSIPEVYIDDRTHAPLLNLNANEAIDYDNPLGCDSGIPVGFPHIVYINNTDPGIMPFVHIEDEDYEFFDNFYIWGFGEYELDDIFGDNPESLQSKRSDPLTFMNGGNTFNSVNEPGSCPDMGGGASAPWGQGAIDYETNTIQELVCESMFSFGTANCLNSPPLILSNPYHTPSCVNGDQVTLIVNENEEVELSSYTSSQPFERIVVESGATLTIANNCVLYFSSIGYVEVKKGGRLIIDNSTLTKCGSEKWQGIRAYTDNRSGPEGEVVIRNGSKIEYATVGLTVGRNSFFDYTMSKVTITGERSRFEENDIGIFFNPGTTLSTISNCYFFNRESDINLLGSTGLTVENSKFNKPFGSSWEFRSISSYNSSFKLTGNEFFRVGTAVAVGASLPFSNGAQIGSVNSAPNTFDRGTIGILSYSLTGPGQLNIPAISKIENNIFLANTFGVYCGGYNWVDVTENTFNYSGGVTFDATGNLNNTINCNTFNDSDIEFKSNNANSEFLSNDFNGGSTNVELEEATIRSFVGSSENPAGNCFSGSNNISVDNASNSFNYLYSNVACQNPSGSGFNKILSDANPNNGCSNGRSPFANIDPDGDGELGLSEASYNAENICKPCILDSIALWANKVTNLGGDDLYTAAEEINVYPTEAQLRAERILLEWINYGIFSALNAKDYSFATEILTPLKKWEYESQLFGIIMLKRDYSEAESFLDNMSENNLNESYFKYIQQINLKIYTNPSDSTAEVTQLMLDSLEIIALSKYPVKGYAASLHYFITGEDVVLEKLLEEEKAEEKEGEVVLANSVIANVEFSVFPNPVSDHLTIETETELTSLSVYDLNGKNWILSNAGNLKRIDTSRLPKGLYILQATNEFGKLYNVKFIKQ